MAKKYIDADLLLKKINDIEEEARKVRVSGKDKEAIGADGKVRLCLKLKAIIGSLQQELVEVKVKPLMGYHKSCGFVATEIELQGYGVICENGEGKIYTEK